MAANRDPKVCAKCGANNNEKAKTCIGCGDSI